MQLSFHMISFSHGRWVRGTLERTSSIYLIINPVETSEWVLRSNEIYERDMFCVTPKSKNQIQMMEANQETEFESNWDISGLVVKE